MGLRFMQDIDITQDEENKPKVNTVRGEKKKGMAGITRA